ncbi:unnamed protein product [Nyctereutes procyonoides]|uniref:(raccoon dog) hypothetical protein n=1 Tax=Nyctereutes procyonoides TaxID=34880 RepID=A0A811XR08_NYCPR|nr:CDGSH iron-sulfur domain-containing protein 3, mitochondrial [Nyctereutes procyonoides]CAD7667259.1 unnamed protein product [Nyctereutes procyonoides]
MKTPIPVPPTRRGQAGIRSQREPPGEDVEPPAPGRSPPTRGGEATGAAAGTPPRSPPPPLPPPPRGRPTAQATAPTARSPGASSGPRQAGPARWAGAGGDPGAGRSRRGAAAEPGMSGVGASVRPAAWSCLRTFQRLSQRRDLSSWLSRWFPKTPAKSVVALKAPIKVELVAGKTYRWCVCGRSKKQPFCDGSHFFQRTGLSPLKFKAQETRVMALCTCKATQKPPYCDGTHRSERVQKAELGSPL